MGHQEEHEGGLPPSSQTPSEQGDLVPFSVLGSLGIPEKKFQEHIQEKQVGHTTLTATSLGWFLGISPFQEDLIGRDTQIFLK